MKFIFLLSVSILFALQVQAEDPNCVKKLAKLDKKFPDERHKINRGTCGMRTSPVPSRALACNEGTIAGWIRKYDAKIDARNALLVTCQEELGPDADEYLAEYSPLSHFSKPTDESNKLDCDRLFAVQGTKGYEILRLFETYKHNPRAQSITKDMKTEFKRLKRRPEVIRQAASKEVWRLYREDPDIGDLRSRIEYGEITIATCNDVLNPSYGDRLPASAGGSDR